MSPPPHCQSVCCHCCAHATRPLPAPLSVQPRLCKLLSTRAFPFFPALFCRGDECRARVTPLPLTGQLSPCAPLVGDGSTELSPASTIVASRWPALPLLTRGPLALPRPMMRRGGRCDQKRTGQKHTQQYVVFHSHVLFNSAAPTQLRVSSGFGSVPRPLRCLAMWLRVALSPHTSVPTAA